MTAESLPLTFAGHSIELERIFESTDGDVAHYIGEIGEESIEVVTYSGNWTVEFAGKSCSAQTIEEAIAKLEKACAPLARVLVGLVES
jgi:hypothetical protein